MKKDSNVKNLWDHIDQMNDDMITYLLYKEGKSIPIIGKIRGMTIEEVNHQLIQAKAQLYPKKKKKEKSCLERMLEVAKQDRKDILSHMTKEEKRNLAREIYLQYHHMDNPEDKILVIWIIGELKIKELLPMIYRDIRHPHGNIRRMICSAINKTGDEGSVSYLHRSLLDSKPQVRQYAAKALGKFGNKYSIRKLKGLLLNPNEKEYVKRAFQEAIKNIETRVKTI